MYVCLSGGIGQCLGMFISQTLVARLGYDATYILASATIIISGMIYAGVCGSENKGDNTSSQDEIGLAD